MKRKMLSFTAVVAFATALFAFSQLQPTGIIGKVAPADAVEAVWAVNGADSVKGSVSSGIFNVPVKQGTYKLVIDAKEPYQDAVLENLQVGDELLDVGEIQLKE